MATLIVSGEDGVLKVTCLLLVWQIKRGGVVWCYNYNNRRMEGCCPKLGFYDCTSNTFYQVDSPEEYERCLQHYYKVIQEE